MERNKHAVWIWPRTRKVYGPKIIHSYEPLVFECCRKSCIADEHTLIIVSLKVMDEVEDMLDPKACRHCGSPLRQVGEYGPADPAHIARHRSQLRAHHRAN